jgi:hypothetical protein
MTTLRPAAPDYTDRDFSAIKARIETELQALFPDWTDYNRASFGVVLIEAFAFMGDNVGFYLDQMAAETRWGTAILRRSIIELAKLIAYELDGATAATATETFTLSSGLASGVSVTIPTGTFVSTLDRINPIRMQLLADLVISNPDVTGDVTVEHSESHLDSYTATGEADQEFALSQTPFLDASEIVVIGGDVWTEVDFFLDYGPADKVFTLVVDENDRASIKVGDGNNGAIPAPGAAVTVTYKTGGGERGNVEANTLTKLEGGPFFDSAGNPVTLSVNNAAAASGGADRETVEQARIRAPRSLRALNRTVARTDYSDRAIQIQGVGRALALSSNEDPTVPEGVVRLYIVPPDSGVASAPFLASIKSEIETNYPIPIGVALFVLSAIYNSIDVDATVYLSADTTEAEAVTAILAALRDFFAAVDDDGEPNEAIQFGFDYKDADGAADPRVALSDVSNAINDLEEVRRMGTPDDGEGLELAGSEDDVILLVREFPKVGTVTITNGDTAAVIYSGSV